MGILIAVALIIVVGAFFMLRERPAEADAPAVVEDADARELTDRVTSRLRDRLAGWTLEADREAPMTLIAQDEATERKIYVKLDDLARRWTAARARSEEDADALIDAFVAGVTGEREEGAEDLDLSGAVAALAVELVSADKAPAHALSRPVGELSAVLVLRNPAGPDRVSVEDLRVWGLDEPRAFSAALSNLATDVEEGLKLEPLEELPSVLRIAAGDPVASGYAVTALLQARLSARFEGRPYLLGAGPGLLLAAENRSDLESLVPAGALVVFTPESVLLG